MKAFIASLIAIAAIAVVAKLGLDQAGMSAQDVYSSNRSVRL